MNCPDKDTDCVPVMRADTGEYTEQVVDLQLCELNELFVELHAISELPIVDARAMDGNADKDVLELSALFDVPDEQGDSVKVDPFMDEKKENTTPDDASPHAKRLENAITGVDGQIEAMDKSDVDKQMEVEHRDMEVELSISGQEAVDREGVGNVTKEDTQF